MFFYEKGKYIIKLLDKSNINELREVQHLRYINLLKEFNKDLKKDDEIDDDGYDQYTDSIIVIDKELNEIVGTYRIATKLTLKGNHFMTESEFNIDSLLKNDNIMELGRAVVKDDHRDGNVIMLLWAGILEYVKQNNIKYIFGTCSLSGVDPSIHKETLNYLKEYKISKEFNMYSSSNSFEYPNDGKIANEKELPPLLRFYLKFGAEVSRNGYIDYSFNSCDVITLVDVTKVNPRYLAFYQDKLK